MRRADRQLDEASANAIFDTCDWITVSMIAPDNTPYAVPLSGVRDGDILYVHCALEGRKLDCLRANPDVWITAVGATYGPPDRFTYEYECAMAKGKAHEVTDELEKAHALRILCERYTPDNMDKFERALVKSLHRTGVWKIVMTEKTAKRHGNPAAYATGAARAGRDG